MSINANEEFIKRAFLQDIKSLTEEAKTKGVTAYADKPSRPSLRPNERFLRNTISSVEHSNRRAQESEMWARRKAQLEREGVSTEQQDDATIPGKREEEEEEGGDDEGKRAIKSAVHNRLGITTSDFAADDEPHHPLIDVAGGGSGSCGVGEVQRKVRGRGGTGPRIGPSGAYLPDPEIGLDSILVEEKGIKRKINSSEPQGRKKERAGMSEGETSRGSSGDNSSSSDAGTRRDSDSEAEERRRRRKKRRRKEKESRKDEKRKRRKEKRKKKEKRKEKKRRREEKSKKQSKDKSCSSD